MFYEQQAELWGETWRRWQVSDVGKAGIGVGMDTPEKRVEVRRLPFDPYTGKPYPPPDEDQQSER